MMKIKYLSLLCVLILSRFGQNKILEAKNIVNNNTEEENILKTEVKKYIKECGIDGSDEDYNDKYDHENKQNLNGHDGYGSSIYNREATEENSNNKDCEDYMENPFKTENQDYKRDTPDYQYDTNLRNNYRPYSYGERRNNHNHGSNCNHNNNEDNNYGTGNRNSYGNSNPYHGNGRNEGNSGGRSNYGRNNNRNGGRSYENNEPNFNANRRNEYGYTQRFGMDDFFRVKRSEGDVLCVSQCVFGYLEVLNENRIPSESAIIKFLQDHIPNGTKRIRSLRDARRCFAKLSATDNEDGCEFSKLLSKCLNLEIE